MNRCIVIPDSFKGTLSSIEASDIMKDCVLSHYSDADVITIPIADGGEGTVDCFMHAFPSDKIYVDTTGPFGEPVRASYAIYHNTAIIEMCQAAGMRLTNNRPNPYTATTYGIGNIVKDAISRGCTQIVIGLGDGCTNDGGVGLALSLGTKFYDNDHNEFVPSANTLHKINHINCIKTLQLLKGTTITAMCDIDTPLYGPLGTAYIFAPQKGADDEMSEFLDYNLRCLSDTIKKSLLKDISIIKGSGAAGGLGGGIVAFLNGRLYSSIDTLLELVDFDSMLEGTDVIFTGEGQIDSQSLHGKIVTEIAKKAKTKNIPVIAIAGTTGDGAYDLYNYGVSSIFSMNNSDSNYTPTKRSAAENLRITMDSILRLYKVIKKS